MKYIQDNFDTLSEFDKEDVQSLCRTLRKDSNNPMTIGPIIEKRLIIAACLSKHYSLTRMLLNSTLIDRPRLKHFGQYMTMMRELKDQDTTDLEKVRQKYSIIKFMEDFPVYLKTQISVRGIPLSYVIRELDAPAPLNAL